MSFPRHLELVQRLDDDPRYQGSIHDAAVARARGFPGALVPGAFVYGHISRVAVQAWGEAWIRHGAMAARFRRPVFDGDALTLVAGPLADGDMRRSEVMVRNGAGDPVATGWIGMAAGAPPEPPLPADLPWRDDPEPLPVAPGGMVAGLTFSSPPRRLDAAEIARSAAAFGETEPVYPALGIAHSGCLMRIAMGDCYRSFRFPAPVILLGVETQHFAPVHAGQVIETRGRVIGTRERNGRHQFEADEWMLADGAVAARFRRTTIYG